MNDGEHPTHVMPPWQRLAETLPAATVLVVGAAGRGKTTLARYLVQKLAARGSDAALLSADVGQAAIGLPACLAVSLEAPWTRADFSYFAGSTTPARCSLALLAGTARLAQQARSLGARAIVVDTCGLVGGQFGRSVRLSQAVAAQAEQIVCVEGCGRDDDDAQRLAQLLETRWVVHRVPAAPQAADRTPKQRRAFRQAQFARHLKGGTVRVFDGQELINRDLSLGLDPAQPLEAGSLVGLLDSQGFCLGLGRVQQVRHDRVLVHAAWDERHENVAWLQLGDLRLSRTGAEL